MIILGNAISFFGCLLMTATGFIKKKEQILTAQCVQFGVQATGHLILGSVAGFVSCIISIARILVFIRVRSTVWLKFGFIALQALLTALTGGETWVAWLPLLSVIIYTWYLDTDNPIVFKFANIIGLAMWVVHDLHYRNYVAVCFDVLTIVSTFIGILLIRRDRHVGTANNNQQK